MKSKAYACLVIVLRLKHIHKESLEFLYNIRPRFINAVTTFPFHLAEGRNEGRVDMIWKKTICQVSTSPTEINCEEGRSCLRQERKIALYLLTYILLIPALEGWSDGSWKMNGEVKEEEEEEWDGGLAEVGYILLQIC